jgi:hypothetical protein
MSKDGTTYAAVGRDSMGNPTDPSSMLSDESIAPVDQWSTFGKCCDPKWGPSAQAEAQTLAVAGSLEGHDYGAASIQNAINKAEGASLGYNDCQLQKMLHY